MAIFRSKAPLRISFAGGGTDVSPYPEEKGGAVLNCTIDKFLRTFGRAYIDQFRKPPGANRCVDLADQLWERSEICNCGCAESPGFSETVVN